MADTDGTGAPKKRKTPAKKKSTAAKASGAGTQAKKKASTTKRRKPSKATSAASAQLIANDARAAAAHLSLQQANNLAKRTDPLWYRMEDVIPASMTATDAKKTGVAEEFQAVENALHAHKLTRADVTPQALACLLEHIRRYRQELVSSAKKYAEAARSAGAEVTKADLQFAAELRHDHPVALATQLPKLNLLAQQVNRVPLPAIPDSSYAGVLLPPAPHLLTARTFDVLSGAATAQKMQMPFPRPPKTSAGGSGSAGGSATQGTYGAARGRQIPVKLKTAAATMPATPGGGPTPMDTSPTTTKT